MEHKAELAKTKRDGARANYILVGISGSGKTTIGRCLAQKLGLGFLDLDHFIENSTNKSIRQIFLDQGEQAFREKEQESLTTLLDINNHVIAIGAGALSLESIEILKQIGTIIWLDCSSNVAAYRIIRETGGLKRRPLLETLLAETDPNALQVRLREQIDSLLNLRKDLYKLADLSFHESFLSPEDSARRLKKIIENRETNSKLLGKQMNDERQA